MDKGRFGEYTCNPCGRKWYSGNFDHNSYQLCKSCEKTKCLPKIIHYNTNNPPRHIQKVLKYRHMNQRRPHLSSHCQNCLEGKFCFSKENETPKKQNENNVIQMTEEDIKQTPLYQHMYNYEEMWYKKIDEGYFDASQKKNSKSLLKC